MEVKIFTSDSSGSLQKNINIFLNENINKINVTHVTQSVSGNFITISLFYENILNIESPLAEFHESSIISGFFLHYQNKYNDKKIKFVVDKNSTISYGDGKYIMIVEEGSGYDTVLELFFLE